MAAHETWFTLGSESNADTDIPYRKKKIYEMNWNVDLTKYMVSIAPFGGPIALIRRPGRLVKLDISNRVNSLDIYSASGVHMSSINWTKETVEELGWSKDEEVVVVTVEGNVFMYDLFGTSVNQFSMGREAREEGVHLARVWSTGVMVITCSYQVYVVDNFKEPRAYALADPLLSSLPLDALPIPTDTTPDGTPEVLIAAGSLLESLGGNEDDENLHHSQNGGMNDNIGDESEEDGIIIHVDSAGTQDHHFKGGSFHKLALDPTGKLLAALTRNGDLRVMFSDFSKTLTTLSLKTKVAPEQIIWCGSDCVALSWSPEALRKDGESAVLMVGPTSKYTQRTFRGPIAIASEVDGMRVISNTKSRFIHRVPKSYQHVFQLEGAIKPAAMLYYAYNGLSQGEDSAIDTIHQIGSDDALIDAANTCIDAALHEYDDSRRRHLLRAASFGKSFLSFTIDDEEERDHFRNEVKQLRLLIAIADPSIGIPLTSEQYRRLPGGLDHLLLRLAARRHHLLAVRIAEELQVSPSAVLHHWACLKVRTADMLDTDDHQLCIDIVDKLRGESSVSYARIAQEAFYNARNELAKLLLEHEPYPEKQVPLFLEMQEYELALRKAIHSGDTSLIFYCIFKLKEQLSSQELFRMIMNKPQAVTLFASYLKEQDPEFLAKFYDATDQSHQVAYLRLYELFQRGLEAAEDDGTLITTLKTAHNRLNKVKERAVDAKAVQDTLRLHNHQREVDTKLGKKMLVGLNLTTTLFYLFILGEDKRAAKIKSEFKVNDKRWWWIKIRALAREKRWETLEKFSKSKRSPIGYEPFVEVCLAAGDKGEALRYIPRVLRPARKISLYLELEKYDEAIEVAHKLKDVSALEHILSNCATDKIAAAKCRQAIEQLTKK